MCPQSLPNHVVTLHPAAHFQLCRIWCTPRQAYCLPPCSSISCLGASLSASPPQQPLLTGWDPLSHVPVIAQLPKRRATLKARPVLTWSCTRLLCLCLQQWQALLWQPKDCSQAGCPGCSVPTCSTGLCFSHSNSVRWWTSWEHARRTSSTSTNSNGLGRGDTGSWRQLRPGSLPVTQEEVPLVLGCRHCCSPRHLGPLALSLTDAHCCSSSTGVRPAWPCCCGRCLAESAPWLRTKPCSHACSLARRAAHACLRDRASEVMRLGGK